MPSDCTSITKLLTLVQQGLTHKINVKRCHKILLMFNVIIDNNYEVVQ